MFFETVMEYNGHQMVKLSYVFEVNPRHALGGAV